MLSYNLDNIGLVQIRLPLKMKWIIEDLDDRTIIYNLIILLPGNIVNVCMHLLHIGTPNYKKQIGRSCILENKDTSMRE